MPVTQAISLFDLNNRIRLVLEKGINEPVWVIAEISDLSVNRNGHCYLELVEKSPDDDRILARSKATIWANTLRILKPYFETTTGQELVPGIKILIRVSVEFHELYSISLNIIDIEPSFTIGEMARNRQLIIRRLEDAGIFDMNKGLEMPLVPQRIAVISSPTAAGYGDFTDQLKNNSGNYVFYTRLFPAVMQGQETVPTIIAALDEVAAREGFFDVVVIIRGGGSKLDLSSFDHYDLGYYVTQFPLPVITGIGHEQDDSVLDLVAHTRCKTPTAVAEFLISRIEDFENGLDSLAEETTNISLDFLTSQREQLSLAVRSVRLTTKGYGDTQRLLFGQAQSRFRISTKQFFRLAGQKITNYAQISLHYNPENLLQKGYSLAYKNGKLVKSVTLLQEGDRIVTKFIDGDSHSVIQSVNRQKKNT
ncbi:MAG: exodeoxyribonuclease VII large subunit [Bacteroidota bacterium]